MVVLTEEDLREAGLDGRPCSFPRAAIDSRETKPGDLFVCLKGESTDGHLFVRDACERGAALILCEGSRSAAVRETLADFAEVGLLVSADPLASFQSIGRIRRRRFQGTVIAVAGSNGKTSTKDILASLLRSLFGEDRVFATPGNWNNHLGLPLSLCALPDEALFAVLELGMNHPGEIEFLAKMARPHHVVVPSIGFEHMEFFQNVEEVAKAELEVLAGVEAGGMIVYPASAPLGDVLVRESASRTFRPVFFHLEGSGSIPEGNPLSFVAGIYRPGSSPGGGAVEYLGHRFSTGGFRGEAMASNLLACLVLLLSIRLDPSAREHVSDANETSDLVPRLAKACDGLTPIAKGRFRAERIGASTIVDDTYNANPDSFRQSLRSLREILPAGRLLCLAGHMAELGHFSREGHAAVGRHLRESGIAGLMVCGHDDVREIATAFGDGNGGEIKYFENSESLSNYIETNPDSVRGWDGILVKGSRSARMEKVLPALRRALGAAPQK